MTGMLWVVSGLRAILALLQSHLPTRRIKLPHTGVSTSRLPRRPKRRLWQGAAGMPSRRPSDKLAPRSAELSRLPLLLPHQARSRSWSEYVVSCEVRSRAPGFGPLRRLSFPPPLPQQENDEGAAEMPTFRNTDGSL